MRIRIVLALFTVLSLALVGHAEEKVPPKPSKHVEQDVEGWTVHVDTRLLEGPDADLGKRTLKILTSRLFDVKMAVSAPKVQRLQQVHIWLDRTHGELTSAQYHPGAAWLKSHGYDERMVKCVHIPDAREYASVNHQRVQPWSILHELAHAYHDQVLDFENAEIKAAWKAFKEGGKYQKTLHINGSMVKHYALTNQMEFFAEMTESYFGTNDFFPFNRAELKREEPEIFALLAKIWDAPPEVKIRAQGLWPFTAPSGNAELVLRDPAKLASTALSQKEGAPAEEEQAKIVADTVKALKVEKIDWTKSMLILVRVEKAHPAYPISVPRLVLSDGKLTVDYEYYAPVAARPQDSPPKPGPVIILLLVERFEGEVKFKGETRNPK